MIAGIFLTEWVLPFLLLFVIVFALLEKSKLLGDGVSQIDALVSLAVAFLSIGVPYSRQVITELMPWLGVGLVSLFVFFVLYSFIVGDKLFEEKKTEWLKYVLIGIVGIFAFGIIFQVTGFWEKINGMNSFFTGEMISNILIIVVLVVLVFWVLKSSGKEK
jgi:hypothetical protein